MYPCDDALARAVFTDDPAGVRLISANWDATSDDNTVEGIYRMQQIFDYLDTLASDAQLQAFIDFNNITNLSS